MATATTDTVRGPLLEISVGLMIALDCVRGHQYGPAEYMIKEVWDKVHALSEAGPDLYAALLTVQECAIERRGEDFNLTTEQWLTVNTALAKARVWEAR